MSIYFDNAATSWPKPVSVIEAMNRFNLDIGSNPGRSGHHLSVESGRLLYNTREILAELFGVSDPLRIAFTSNITHSLNIIIMGMLKPGDHVITTSIEHNSVMRPLRELESRGLELTVIPCSSAGLFDPDNIHKYIKSNTKLIITTHSSNVTGTILPVTEIGKIASQYGIPYCVDSAQSAGVLDIDVVKSHIDILCFTGHKGLFGPMGTGGLYIKKDLEKAIAPLMYGGTGSRSELEIQPDFMPDKYESGTLNTIGIAGLYAGVKFITDTGLSAIHAKENSLLKRFITGVSGFKKTILYGAENPDDRTAVSAFNIEGLTPSDVSYYLDEQYGILTRPGLHCAPSAHKTIGTFPSGTNRISFGYFNTPDEVDTAIRAIHELTKQ
ncbi:MAG: cysteine desulfurase [Spirochaetae bacterium HGW-Spirochaetae-5]|nr:MAG: cysteine desulfurase [Spirochaetae bacterium HGW-Spirochaetae-5]